jgi:hypothetical protein
VAQLKYYPEIEFRIGGVLAKIWTGNLSSTSLRGLPLRQAARFFQDLPSCTTLYPGI